jgi:tetrahydromethanopterin S-methyltransferase subunit C
MVSRVMAGCLALAAFAIAIFAGLAAGNAAGLVLVRALMAMILCYPVGFIIGMICQRVIEMHAPAPSEPEQEDESDAEPSEDAAGEHAEEVITV